MSNLDKDGMLKPIFKVAELGASFDESKTHAVTGMISDILSRPIEGLNIVTTHQTDDVQFYGWKSPIKRHTDGTGYIFFMPIFIESPDLVFAGAHSERMALGTVYALDDAIEHGTVGNGRIVAAFWGSATAEQAIDQSYLDDIARRIKESCFSE